MKGLHKILVPALMALLMLFATPVLAQPGGGLERIAAVVNNDAITGSEVAARTKLILVSSGLPDTPDVRQKLKPQIVNALIEERLMMQEAKRLNVTVSKEDVSRGFETVAKQNNMTADQFKQVLAHNNIPVSTLQDQIQSQLAWGDVIQKKIRPQVTISDSEIDSALQRLQADVGKQQYLVADIFLAVGTPQDEARVRALADRLVAEIVKNHIPFSRVASQFSQAPGAERGGDLGWVQNGQLAPELDRMLASMKPGELAKPVRTEGGYHILFLRKETTVAKETLPSRDGLTEKLGMEELERRQRRYLMDLKAAAFIEHRA
jgi:peptidyl-prolyl cis-trans isomerase SurA